MRPELQAKRTKRFGEQVQMTVGKGGRRKIFRFLVHGWQVPGTNWGPEEGNWFGEEDEKLRAGSARVRACGEVWAWGSRRGVVRKYRTELWVEGVQGPRRRGSSRGRQVLLRSPPGLGGGQPCSRDFLAV